MKDLIGWLIVVQVTAFCYVQMGMLPVALWCGAAGGWVLAQYDSGYQRGDR